MQSDLELSDDELNRTNDDVMPRNYSSGTEMGTQMMMLLMGIMKRKLMGVMTGLLM